MKKIISKIFMICLMIFGIVLVPSMSNRRIVNAEEATPKIVNYNAHGDWFIGFCYQPKEGQADSANDTISGVLDNGSATVNIVVDHQDGAAAWILKTEVIPAAFTTTSTYTGTFTITHNGEEIVFNVVVVDGKLVSHEYVVATDPDEPKLPELKLGAQAGLYDLGTPLVIPAVADDETVNYTVEVAKTEGAQFWFEITFSQEIWNELQGFTGKFNSENLKDGENAYQKGGNPAPGARGETGLYLYCSKNDANFANITGTGVIEFESGYKLSFTPEGYYYDTETNRAAFTNYNLVLTKSAQATAVRFIARLSNFEENDLKKYSDVVITVKVGEKEKSYKSEYVYKSINANHGISTPEIPGVYYSVVTFTNVPSGTVFSVSAVAHGVDGVESILAAETTFTLTGNTIA